MMRDCYKKFWKTVLVEQIALVLPMFMLKETPSRKAADEAKPSSKPVSFVWGPVDKLKFVINFSAPGRQDHFEAWCGWSETGASRPDFGPLWAQDDPFRYAAFSLAQAQVPFQALSAASHERPTTIWWYFWKPTTELGDTRESHAAFMAEALAEELRPVPDVEARQRVEEAVRKSMSDLKRCALPWFERKLEWYLSKSRAVG